MVVAAKVSQWLLCVTLNPHEEVFGKPRFWNLDHLHHESGSQAGFGVNWCTESFPEVGSAIREQLAVAPVSRNSPIGIRVKGHVWCHASSTTHDVAWMRLIR